MNLLEYENERFGDLWNEKTIKELKEYQPPKRSYPLFTDIDRCNEGWEFPSEPQYILWRGYKMPNWIE